MSERRQPAFSFAVVCEARADQEMASGLAERVLVEEVDWIEPESLPHLCRWRGLDTTQPFLAWRNVTHEARRRRITRHGRFRAVPGSFDERRARLALRLFKSLPDPPDAIFLVRDTDRQEARVESLRRVRDDETWSTPVVLAAPHPKRECWVLAGFEPADPAEASRLAEVREHLGFDPRHKAERLTAEGKKGKRNAKTVLERLLASGSPRERACWRDADLTTLRQRGTASGLTDYLREISECLVPLFAETRTP